jgi:hypothetical protein
LDIDWRDPTMQPTGKILSKNNRAQSVELLKKRTFVDSHDVAPLKERIS